MFENVWYWIEDGRAVVNGGLLIFALSLMAWVWSTYYYVRRWGDVVMSLCMGLVMGIAVFIGCVMGVGLAQVWSVVLTAITAVGGVVMIIIMVVKLQESTKWVEKKSRYSEWSWDIKGKRIRR